MKPIEEGCLVMVVPGPHDTCDVSVDPDTWAIAPVIGRYSGPPLCPQGMIAIARNGASVGLTRACGANAISSASTAIPTK